MSNDKHVLPVVEAMEALPENNNPFQHDAFHMGSEVSGAWIAMYDKHAGIKQDHNMSDEEKVRASKGEAVFYDDPDYIIMVNQRTGQRFKLVFP